MLRNIGIHSCTKHNASSDARAREVQLTVEAWDLVLNNMLRRIPVGTPPNHACTAVSLQVVAFGENFETPSTNNYQQ